MNIKEYKGLTAKEISEATGLPNPYTDQSKYSLYRQWELMLWDAKRNNVLHLVKKTNIINNKSVHFQTDKDLVITRLYETPVVELTTTLDLNTIPHKVVRERGVIGIYVNQSDIPKNVTSFAYSKGYSYNVIGILTSEKCYPKQRLYKDGKCIGSSYKFYMNKTVTLYIMN
ncbi:MAG: hypothetical protein [Caudoviricetes sp.]|nr:MAG: hypothetical protein [Caudoviricetes sp.]